MVSEIEVAWLAGLLEGEGSFQMITSHHAAAGRSYRYPKIRVNMTDRDIIERAAAMFGTKVYALPAPKPGDRSKKQQWLAGTSGEPAAEWMRRIYPYMGERRRARIDEVLAEQAAKEPMEIRRSRNCAAAQRRRRGNTTLPAGSGLTREAVRVIFERTALGHSQSQIGRDLGVSGSSVWRVLNGKTWASVSREMGYRDVV